MSTNTNPKNQNLNDAKTARDDEFYTHITDIATELKHLDYKNFFNGKSVLCNCNDNKHSGFYKFFTINFYKFNLKKLICISYGTPAYAFIMTADNMETKRLDGDGSYRSTESFSYLQECNIVCTNPPFSCFRNFISLLAEYNKDFLIIGNAVSVSTNSIFPLFRNGTVRFGFSTPHTFECTDKEKGVFAQWYTTIPIDKIPTMPEPTKSYAWNASQYPVYDNFNAIHVQNVRDMPNDYMGYIGIPISFLTCYDPKEFNLIGTSAELAEDEILPDGSILKNPGRFYLHGKRLFDRIVVQRSGDYDSTKEK